MQPRHCAKTHRIVCPVKVASFAIEGYFQTMIWFCEYLQPSIAGANNLSSSPGTVAQGRVYTAITNGKGRHWATHIREAHPCVETISLTFLDQAKLQTYTGQQKKPQALWHEGRWLPQQLALFLPSKHRLGAKQNAPTYLAACVYTVDRDTTGCVPEAYTPACDTRGHTHGSCIYLHIGTCSRLKELSPGGELSSTCCPIHLSAVPPPDANSPCW
jgi:hypothetical protein